MHLEDGHFSHTTAVVSEDVLRCTWLQPHLAVRFNGPNGVPSNLSKPPSIPEPSGLTLPYRGLPAHLTAHVSPRPAAQDNTIFLFDTEPPTFLPGAPELCSQEAQPSRARVKFSAFAVRMKPIFLKEWRYHGMPLPFIVFIRAHGPLPQTVA